MAATVSSFPTMIRSSRARELLIIVGNEETVAAMTRNDRRQRRYSGLKLRLEGKA